MSLLLISQAYSLSKDKDVNVSRRSENLKTKTLQFSEKSAKQNCKTKQQKRKFQTSKANKSKTQNEIKKSNSIENPDLFSQWPFNHFKIVFNFEKEREGWKRENNIFAFYENINLEGVETLKENRNPLKSTTPKNLETEKHDPEGTSKSTEEDDIFTPSFLELLEQMENKSVQKMDGLSDGTISKLTPPEESKQNRKQHLKTCGPKTTSVVKFTKPKAQRGKILSKNQCIMCLKQLSRPSQLERHIRIHTQEKPFICSICGESFAQLSSLNVHKKSHTEEKPYQCVVCKNRFNRKPNLERHKLVHSDEKPHFCLVCDRRFSLRESLKRHQRIHTGEKPYQCTICCKKFAHSSSLKRHQRIHISKAKSKS